MKSSDGNGAPSLKCKSVALILGSGYVMTTCISQARASGVLFVAMKNEFQVSMATAGWVISIFAGLLLGAGAISGYLCARLGAPVTATLGTLIMSAGMLASAFVDNVYIMYATFGAVGGIGASLTFVAVQVLIQQNFDKRRALAAGISSLGIGAGALLLPQIQTIVLVSSGLRHTFYLIAGLCFSACFVCVSFIRVARREAEEAGKPDAPKKAGTKTETEKRADPEDKTSTAGSTFMTSGPYMSCLVSVFLGAFAVLVPLNLLPALLAEKGMSPQQVATVLACSGPGDILGKVVTGLLADSRLVDRSVYQVISLMVLGAATLVAMFLRHMYQFICFTAVFGMASGIWTFLQPVVTMDIVGTGSVAQAFGLICMVQGVAATLGLPIAGWLADVTSSYNASLITSSSAFFLAAITVLYVPVHKSRSRSYTLDVTV